MEISIYGTPTCSACKDVINFLDNKEIKHKYSIIGEDIDFNEVNEAVGRMVRTVPVIMVDGTELTFDTLKEKVNSVNILKDLEL